jgi:aldose 1-epimerase
METVTLVNNRGMRLRAIQLGAIIVSLEVPDDRGNLADVVLGHDSPADYLSHPSYFGAVVGRYANRIGAARFTLDGTTYRLVANERPNCLHGGKVGFDKTLWNVESLTTSSVMFRLESPDGDQGFPGKLEARVKYTLTDDNALIVDYDAVTDAPTVINLTQHSYFNLAGHGAGSVQGHELTIAADAYTPVDDALIPTGEIAPVEGTRYDFRSRRVIADAVGYDINFVLSNRDDPLKLAAILRDPRGGRTMTVTTTEPGVQLYTGNHLDGSIIGKNAVRYQRYAGLCLETQHFPDSPNRPSFPSTELRPGEQFTSRTIMTFSSS